MARRMLAGRFVRFSNRRFSQMRFAVQAQPMLANATAPAPAAVGRAAEMGLKVMVAAGIIPERQAAA
ncbi:MAG: hypothetical protein P4L73_03860 [Caulobacteraceae bacterium]|nr:hypothetical protein [Caulobacteraceae bacterium]